MASKSSAARPIEDNERLGALIDQLRNAELIDGVKESLSALPKLLAQEGVDSSSRLHKDAESLLGWLDERTTTAALAEGSELAARLLHAVGAAPYLGLGDEDVVNINKNLALWTRLTSRGAASTGRRRRTGTGPQRSREDLAAVREWARSRNYNIKDRGRIPAPILEDYQAAHA